MEDFLPACAASALFDGVPPSEIRALLGCLSARAQRYERGTFLFMRGDAPKGVGLVLEGRVHVAEEDVMGNRSILAEVGPSELVAEAFACAGIARLPVDAVAAADCRVLWLDGGQLWGPSPSCGAQGSRCGTTPTCAFHSRLVANLMRILAVKNIALHEKLRIMGKRTTRDKLLRYLSARARDAGSAEFEIPFNRQELADYLGVDRSALSTELGKLRDGGLLRFERNRFELLAARSADRDRRAP
ncbi:MAG: Crp/Fnr family transcriptional regulator [Clostridiales bacterium]|nr:Crp/Fnr family transcriptional regulator [Clostridiales bacterium]